MTEDRQRMLQRRAAAVRANPGPPNGQSRSQPFPAEMRAAPVIWNGQERVRLVGCASVTEKRYTMWDMFGEYDEVVDQRAFDATLSRSPDVAYLTNHRGVTMARTTNGTLMLSADSKGLQTEAYVNPKRTDVRDLVTAIEDRDITEMSFAFQILSGEWSEDYSEFRILEVELDRGDVSAVNYGANPYTDVAARQTEILKDLRRLPEGAQREAVRELTSELSAATSRAEAEERAAGSASAENSPPEAETGTEIAPESAEASDDASASADALGTAATASVDEARAKLNEPTGRSIDLARRMLALILTEDA